MNSDQCEEHIQAHTLQGDLASIQALDIGIAGTDLKRGNLWEAFYSRFNNA